MTTTRFPLVFATFPRPATAQGKDCFLKQVCHHPEVHPPGSAASQISKGPVWLVEVKVFASRAVDTDALELRIFWAVVPYHWQPMHHARK